MDSTIGSFFCGGSRKHPIIRHLSTPRRDHYKFPEAQIQLPNRTQPLNSVQRRAGISNLLQKKSSQREDVVETPEVFSSTDWEDCAKKRYLSNPLHMFVEFACVLVWGWQMGKWVDDWKKWQYSVGTGFMILSASLRRLSLLSQWRRSFISPPIIRSP